MWAWPRCGAWPLTCSYTIFDVTQLSRCRHDGFDYNENVLQPQEHKAIGIDLTGEHTKGRRDQGRSFQGRGQGRGQPYLPFTERLSPNIVQIPRDMMREANTVTTAVKPSPHFDLTKSIFPKEKCMPLNTGIYFVTLSKISQMRQVAGRVFQQYKQKLVQSLKEYGRII